MDQLPCSSAAVPLPPSSVSNKIAMTLVDEATAAIQEVSFAVKEIAISRELPRTINYLYVNLQTNEGVYCIELSTKGWRVVSDNFDTTTPSAGFSPPKQHFETIYQLLGCLSPSFTKAFHLKLCEKLRKVHAASTNTS